MGTTHVAVGFTDLGPLLWANVTRPPDANMPSQLPANAIGPRELPAAKKPLQWVGYETSEYACAKAAVLHRMMLQGADVDHILQVPCSASLLLAFIPLSHSLDGAPLRSHPSALCLTHANNPTTAGTKYERRTGISIRLMPSAGVVFSGMESLSRGRVPGGPVFSSS